MIYDRLIAKKRSVLTQKTRDFFTTSGFLEVETPIMTPIPGMEPHLTPFETTLSTPQNSRHKLYLNTSPELQMKKLLGAGFGNIFQITKVFRNGEIGGNLHNPEFTMIEWYREKADYKDIMTDCENLVQHLAESPSATYQNQKIGLEKPWERISVRELFLKFCDIDLLKNKTFEKLKSAAEEKGYSTSGCDDWDDVFFKIFLNEIEPHLGTPKPVFVYDYPATQAALAKKKKDEPFFAERFELYIGGIEIANAFSELTDSGEQKSRLEKEQNLRKKLGKTVFDIDGEFLASLESISNPCAGIALGLDRLFMILLNLDNIEDVLLFPLKKLIKN
ncbi:MAG: EF-P lysine aminoacylase EpmA [Candidatus Peregrinibacteria bacterium]